MPIEPYPDFADLTWLFEVEPTLLDPDLGWPISEAVWQVERGDWKVEIRIGVYDYLVEISCHHLSAAALHVRLNGIVRELTIDRTKSEEALVITPAASAGLHPVRLTLKPSVRLYVENRLPWEDP